MDESENFLNEDNLYVRIFPSKRKKTFFVRISTYTCIQALKFRMQALFLMQIQNLKSDSEFWLFYSFSE